MFDITGFYGFFREIVTRKSITMKWDLGDK